MCGIPSVSRGQCSPRAPWETKSLCYLPAPTLLGLVRVAAAHPRIAEGEAPQGAPEAVGLAFARSALCLRPASPAVNTSGAERAAGPVPGATAGPSRRIKAGEARLPTWYPPFAPYARDTGPPQLGETVHSPHCLLPSWAPRGRRSRVRTEHSLGRRVPLYQNLWTRSALLRQRWEWPLGKPAAA